MILKRGLCINVDRDMHDIEFQEWNQMEAIGAHTSRYMAEVEGETKRNKCIQELMISPIELGMSLFDFLLSRRCDRSVAAGPEAFLDAVSEKSSFHWARRNSDSLE